MLRIELGLWQPGFQSGLPGLFIDPHGHLAASAVGPSVAGDESEFLVFKGGFGGLPGNGFYGFFEFLHIGEGTGGYNLGKT
jgi:hypothetical protein